METLQKQIKNLPHEPGVYIYRNREGEIIYIGKAKDLAKRVRQYFQKGRDASIKTDKLVSEITSLEWIRVTSEFESLLLEARLIRKHIPRYNVISRDDKSPLYVVFTLSEPLPRVLLVRKRELGVYEKKKSNAIYGPFQSAHVLRTILRQLRSIIPYCTQKERNGKPCFYTHIGLCDPCPSAISDMPPSEQSVRTKEYRANILRLKAVFDGKFSSIGKQLEKQMHTYASRERFEDALTVKNRLASLHALSSYRYDPMIFLDRGADAVYDEQLDELLKALQTYYPNLSSLKRIECVDISNLYGKQAVGSLVVLTDGKIDTAEYRKFRIRTVRGISDVAMIKEVLSRRFRHDEWKHPDFLLIDGGKGQVRFALSVLREHTLPIPLAGLAKREEELIIPTDASGKTLVTLRLPINGKAIKVMQRVRDEAHRFAITYHRKLRSNAFLSEAV